MKWLLVLVVLGFACPAPAPVTPVPPHVVPTPPAPDAAVTEAPKPSATALPGLRLPRTFAPNAYDVRLAIEPGQSTFAGATTIHGDVRERVGVVWLHAHGLHVTSATASGPRTATLTVTQRGTELIEVRAEPALEPGAWQLAFEYTGEIEHRDTTGVFEETADGGKYVFSQFEATYARRAFPCIDEPDVKVPWHLTLDVPEKLVAVGNTPVASEAPLGNGKKRVDFAPSKPLPSYLVAFAVGPFDSVDGGKTKSGVPVRAIVLKGRSADAAWIVKAAVKELDFLEDWFGVPYPYAKLDVVPVPLAVGFGAMENAGLVTFDEHILLLDQAKPSWARKHSWVVNSGHEFAHQWFGDLVTTAWWDDLWLNEGFASWLEDKVAARFDPSWHDEQAELEHRQLALAADSLTSARRIRQPIESEGDIVNAFDNITYHKGAAVLAMFEHYVGADVFQRGVREYVKAKSYANATSADFIRAISAVAGKDLAPAFSSFLDQPGAPELAATTVCDGAGPRLELAVSRYVPPGSPAPPANAAPWIVPVCVAYERAGKRAESCTLLDQPRGTLALETKTCPRWVMTNVGARGYYRSHLTAPQLTALRDEAWSQLTWTERRGLVQEINAAMYDGQLPLQLALSFVPKLLAGGDRFTIGDAVALPLGLHDRVPDELRGKYEAAMRVLFAPGATKVGALPKDSDDLDAESVRETLFSGAAWSGRDPELVRQSVELAARWRDLPGAVRASILMIAADASPELYARLLQDVKTEQDRTRRKEIVSALAATRDPERLKTALGLTLDRALDFRMSMQLLQAGSTEQTRTVVEQFFRAHADELLAMVPKDEVTSGAASFAHVFTRACDARRRDEIADYITKRFASFPGGERVVRQGLEGMDQCIARRAILEPEVRAWLGGYRLPRPDAKKPAKK